MRINQSLFAKIGFPLIALSLILFGGLLGVLYFINVSVGISICLAVLTYIAFIAIMLIVLKKQLLVINIIDNAIDALLKNSFKQIDLSQFKTTKDGELILKSINGLSTSLNNTAQFIKKISSGDFTVESNEKTELNVLGGLLQDLQQKLRKSEQDAVERHDKDEKQNWTTEGVAKFSDLLRLHNQNIGDLSYNIISNLADYIGAIQGGIFVKNDDNVEDVFFELSGFVAYDRRKIAGSKFRTGNGLVGRCAFERQFIYIEEIPEDYVYVTSGLGESNPRSLLLVPAILEDEVYAIIELVSFNKLSKYQIEFVEKIGESIASTLANTKANERTKQLLEQSKNQAEELAAHEEELRQNFEELQATQDEVARLRDEEKKNSQKIIDEVEKYKNALLRIVDHIPVKVFLKDHEGKMLFVNKKVLEVHNARSEDLLGKSDFDFIDDYNVAKEYWDKEQEIIKSGKAEHVVHEETINNTGMVLDSTTYPFFIDFLGETGILGVQLDITDNVEKQNTIKELKLEIERLKGA